MTTQTKSRGFTIVELLIVIVVIAILAAITIVAYNGITKNANSSAVKSNAASVRTYATAYQADPNNTTGTYPALSGGALATISGGVATLPSGLTFVTTKPTSTSNKTTITYLTKGSSPITGACIVYWDPASGASGAIGSMVVGDATYDGSGTNNTCS